ncbi:MAG: LLM class flavin-dependent oxidoreductase [Proteobacteria bacterium]|nr:LLM class flavin-dependent oxidoreductase [Pseudomonadota bacterium]
MQFGIFDHVDRADRPLNTQLAERLAYVAAADAAGFYAYHVAEHHATPLNMVPVPGVYLGAVARATTRMRLGPLVYLLPLYSPLRLIEEVAMLDHLSDGRLDIGIGRGVSPFELNYHKVSADQSRAIFLDAFATLREGLTHERLNHAGPYFTYDNVPMELRPLQTPHPPFWYPSSNEGGATWAGEQGLHFVTLGAMATAQKTIAAFKAGFATHRRALSPKPEFPGGAVIGINRQIVVADTDAEAQRIARPARDQHHDSLMKLWRENKSGPLSVSAIPQTYDDAVNGGATIVGSPATVRAAIARQIAALGINYMCGAFFFGNMPLDTALRSLDLFAREVMPGLRDR